MGVAVLFSVTGIAIPTSFIFLSGRAAACVQQQRVREGTGFQNQA
jgi:hypothetical protein